MVQIKQVIDAGWLDGEEGTILKAATMFVQAKKLAAWNSWGALAAREAQGFRVAAQAVKRLGRLHLTLALT